MATANFNIRPEDGWTAVTTGSTTYFRVRSSTPDHAFYVTSGPDLPDATVVGYKVHCHDFKVNVASPDPYYVRTTQNQPTGDTISVFYIGD